MQLIVLLLAGCTPGATDTDLPPRRVGDPDAGWEYLRFGDFVGAGIPKDVWFDLVPPISSNLLDRDGDSAGVPSAFNLFEAPNGVEVVGGVTCLGCHSSWLQDDYFPGLGGYADYTGSTSTTFELASLATQNAYGTDSPEWEAFFPLLRGAQAIAPYTVAPMVGVNPAFSMERAAVAFRDPATLTWQSGEPSFDIPDLVLACDVPPWWNVGKKSRLYWTGAGRGDRATLMSQISMVAVEDAAQFDAIADKMVDVVAWIDALEPPPFPGTVDDGLAEQGRTLFEATCSRCHGTYGDDGEYPDLVVPLDEVGTDPLYAEAFLEPGFTDWLRDSHLASSDYPASFEPERGYVAPPLDGIWATAPYLHNGSVPDLETLLDPPSRPTAWVRTAGDLDLDRIGFAWEAAELPATVDVYDTTQPSFGNGGHLFGEVFDASERAAVLEYLKTL